LIYKPRILNSKYMKKKSFNPKPYVLVGIIFLIAPLIIYVFLGNFYQHLPLCENPLQQQVYVGGNVLVDCVTLRLTAIVVPAFLIVGFILLLYASARKLRR